MKKYSQILSLKINEPIAGRWDAYLAKHFPEKSRSYIQKLIKEGHLTVDGTPYTETRMSPALGAEVILVEEITTQDKIQPQKIPLDILFEDDDIIVFNKPAGLVVHAGAGQHEKTLVNGLLYHCKRKLSAINGVERMGIVHRLDKDTSGVMIAAKSDKAYHSLRSQFDDHSITRKYEGLIWGLPLTMEGSIEKPIARHISNRQKMCVRDNGRPARTDYQVLKAFDKGKICHVEFSLYTGRTHQIRVHLSSLGHPLIGDVIYGKDARKLESIKSSEVKDLIKGLGRQALHAKTLGFIHPTTGEEMTFTHPWPEDLEKIYKTL
ncbi:MAG: RluA family pseudouridine synthase, partial [Alphaproteobacteria bacterium]|nr:RluA family pseudouridine synthase [Alphaproteobacteria bacterium]